MKPSYVLFGRRNHHMLVSILCDSNYQIVCIVNLALQVKQLEDGVVNLVKAADECTHLSSSIQSIGKDYQPAAELTNFSKLFDKKIKRSKADVSSVSQSQLWLRQFREAIWKVHHEGQPMPGEEQEDIIMTSTECTILNATCPLTGKPITELAEPVRSMDCKHIYEKKAIMQHLRTRTAQIRCPVTGCPKKLVVDRVDCDPFLLMEIDEMRSLNAQRATAGVIEDFTQLEQD
ncbi:hypothetical protein SASPL_136358 [Salvia splendens]|uniref:SP-RING-type domain-containing protein n=1 Tax=Salvia splendens TaxID=180675 RepID=A0A8X8X1U2_SALSN|nr:hypothetical protein SASPL_136358 [Salvia splendens]